MKKTTLCFIGLSIVAMGFQNCDSTHNAGLGENTENSFAVEQAAKTVLADKCASCHSAGSSNGNDFKFIMDTQALIDSNHIVPGSPETSRLFLEVVDGVMPPTGEGLSLEERDILAIWIADLGVSRPNPTGGADPGAGGGGSVDPVSFAQVNANIIQPRCVNCHRAGDQSGGVRLDSFAAVSAYISPGNPNASLFYTEISSNNMPTNGTLSTAQKTMVFNWIAQGAANN